MSPKVVKGDKGRGKKREGRADVNKIKEERQKMVEEKKKKKAAEEERVVETRCSLKVVSDAVKELEDVMTPEQKVAIKATPFYNLSNFKPGNSSKNWLQALAECYVPETKTFQFGDALSIPFEPWEFSAVCGLRYYEQMKRAM